MVFYIQLNLVCNILIHLFQPVVNPRQHFYCDFWFFQQVLEGHGVSYEFQPHALEHLLGHFCWSQPNRPQHAEGFPNAPLFLNNPAVAVDVDNADGIPFLGKPQISIILP